MLPRGVVDVVDVNICVFVMNYTLKNKSKQRSQITKIH